MLMPGLILFKYRFPFFFYPPLSFACTHAYAGSHSFQIQVPLFFLSSLLLLAFSAVRIAWLSMVDCLVEHGGLPG